MLNFISKIVTQQNIICIFIFLIFFFLFWEFFYSLLYSYLNVKFLFKLKIINSQNCLTKYGLFVNDLLTCFIKGSLQYLCAIFK